MQPSRGRRREFGKEVVNTSRKNVDFIHNFQKYNFAAKDQILLMDLGNIFPALLNSV
jgi:hypothetical protein